MIAVRDKIEDLEAEMLLQPQVGCPVFHHFGPGIYIREVKLPAGAVAVGHAQKFEHLNIMLSGKVAMVGDNGELRILSAPMIFVGKPGRKVGLILEDCAWLNVYATDETDIAKLEEMFFEKSDAWKGHHEAVHLKLVDLHKEDRDDFNALLKETGFTADIARQQSENEDDQCVMPIGFGQKISVRESPIEGMGIFASSPISYGEIIAPARIAGLRTPAGRYTNHSKNPNAIFVADEIGDIYLVALRDIQGCLGGGYGEEVTVDYRTSLAVAREIEGKKQ